MSEKKVKLDWPPPFKGDECYINILNSVSINGFHCLCGTFGRFALWNPATEKIKAIPRNLFISMPHGIAFALYRGFGYDRFRDDYKVIQCLRIIKLRSSPVSFEFLWEIYSLKCKIWRKIEVDMPCHNCWTLHTSVQVYLDGMCHWWVKCKMHSDRECLVSFDVCKEMLLTTRKPSFMDPSFDSKFVERHLVASNRSIALFSNYKETTIFHISILGEVGGEESWVKLFTVGPLPCIARPIGVGKNSDIFSRKEDDGLVRFDLSTQKIEELGVKGRKIVIYEKSLVSI